MMTSKSTKSRWGVVALATLTMAAVIASPQAAAHKKKKHSAKKHHSTTTQTYSRHSYSSHSSAGNSRVDALEQRLLSMQSELDALRAQQAGAAQADPQTTAKVQELEQWMADSKAKPAKAKDNMVFFRGGYSRSMDNRGGDFSATAFPGGLNGDILVGTKSTDKDAWYFGAGFDWSLSDNAFGLINGTEVLAELMFDYKELSGKTNSVLTGQSVTTNQLTLAASPKIKFLKGHAFRPWLIPVGFELSVISPPSGAVTVLNPGIQFGLGADYKIWNNLYVGADARYHYSADNVDGVNTDGVTAGGYLGIGF